MLTTMYRIALAIGMTTLLSCATGGTTMQDRDGTLSYKPTQEDYDDTFGKISRMIDDLNEIIKNRDFASWLLMISDEYRLEKNDPAFLAELSELPTLKRQNIRLKSIRDYFDHVIVPSRAKTNLERIVFIDRDRVKALSTLYGQPVILYYFVRKGNSWKISIVN